MKNMKFILLMNAVLFLTSSCIINDLNGQANIVIDQAQKDFDNVASIVVKGSFCNVNVIGQNAENVAFKGEIKSNKEREDVKISYKQSGSDLEVWIERPSSLRGSFKGVLDFKVPMNTNIKVKNSSGSVNVSNIGQSIVDLSASSGSIKAENIDSNLDVVTSSGSIKTINIGGDLHISCSSGSQYMNTIGGDVEAKVSSGGIKAEKVNGNLTSTSSSGSQHLSEINGDVRAEASSGSIGIHTVKGDVRASASSGSIKLTHIEGALNLHTSSGGQYGEDIILTGNSSFKSSSGGIKMGLSNGLDELSFDLTASSGGLHAKGTNGKKHLEIKKGDILVHGVSSSGGQKYY